MMELALRCESFCLAFVICVLLTLNTISAHNATKVVYDSRFDQQQVFANYDQDPCPPWFHYNWDTQTCQCLAFYAARCFDNKAYLSAGFCATYDEETKTLSLSTCPYHGFTISKHDRHWYTQLPENVSELNNYMCGPLNRKGRVCSECRDGFGFAATSIGFQYFECSNCTGTWYGVPLYLFLELFPLTVFYLIILISQINITSGSITCFIMYSQLTVIAMDRVFAGDNPRVSDIILAASEHSEWLFTITMTVYDIWNLRFFRNVLPSFCISSGLKPMHVSFLNYITVFYPLSMIFLTWVCVELYDRKFRLLVWLWKPFQRCFKGKHYTIDFINAFASFFLLSLTKVMYQLVLLLVQRKIENKDYENFNNFLGFTYVVGVDQSVIYGSKEHLFFIIPAVIIFFILVVLPSLLLTFYPFHLFRALFSKCKLDGIVVNTFVEKFYSCYRNGLDGGKDMRSFAGLYLFTRLLLFCSNTIASVLMVSNNDPYFIRSIICTIIAILIALCRPYKETYMNVLDTILMAHMGLLCHLVSSEDGFSLHRNVTITYEAMITLPIFCFVLFFIAKAFRLKKYLVKGFEVLFQRCKSCYTRNNVQDDCSTFRTSSIRQVLIEPISVKDSYGSF